MEIRLILMSDGMNEIISGSFGIVLCVFLSRDAEFTHLIGEINATYEVHLFDDDTAEKGLFEVFVGVEIDCEKTSVIPVGLCLKTLPKTQYAVFTFQGAQIKSDWEKAIQDSAGGFWLSKLLFL